MNAWRPRISIWQALGLCALALVVHLLAVWAVPRVVMHQLMRAARTSDTPVRRGASLLPPADATSRRVVMPSPDLLYAVCLYDVAARPLRIRANPQLTGYWSIALYAGNSDNFLVINDRQAQGRPVDLWLVSERANPDTPAPPVSAQVVISPTRTGLLLMRVLAAEPVADRAALDAARQSLWCEAA